MQSLLRFRKRVNSRGSMIDLMPRRFCVVGALSCALAAIASGQRTILAVGAHAGDVELTSGALLAKQHRLGDRVVILHLTLG